MNIDDIEKELRRLKNIEKEHDRKREFYDDAIIKARKMIEDAAEILDGLNPTVIIRKGTYRKIDYDAIVTQIFQEMKSAGEIYTRAKIKNKFSLYNSSTCQVIDQLRLMSGVQVRGTTRKEYFYKGSHE